MKLGTIIKLSDGRIGTVVFNSLIGVGIKWGKHFPNPEDFAGTNGNLLKSEPMPDDWPWQPDALLRKPLKPNAFKDYGFSDKDCVGEDYEVIPYGHIHRRDSCNMYCGTPHPLSKVTE